MKTILTLVAAITFSFTSSSAYCQKATKNDTVVMLGKISKENFKDKGNTVIKTVFDYWFISGDKKYFIKCYGSSFTKEMLEKWVGESVKIKAIIKKGEWDSTGDPDKVQSRTGEYITVLEIKKL